MKSSLLGLVLTLTALVATAQAAPPAVVLEVEAGRYDRRATPVELPVPGTLTQARAFTLEGLDDHQPVDVQVVPGKPARIIWIVRDLPHGSTRRYLLKPSDAPQSAADVTVTDDGKALWLKVKGRPVLGYNHAVVDSPAGIDPVYQRSGYIHPLFTPSGLAVTGDFAPDHAHQHGIFFAWVNTTFNGHHVDFWNQKEKTGRVRHMKVLGSVDGPVLGEFTVSLRHEDISGSGDPVPVLDEVWTVRAYDLADRFLVDFESRQTCAASKPLEMNTYHYGGMGMRGNFAWFDPSAKGNDPPDPARSGQSDFLTSEGKGRTNGNHTRPSWVDLSGAVGKEFGGVAWLDHPANFRFPQPVRLHPNKPYFCFAPSVTGAFAIEPGHSHVSRYRLDVHDGRPDAKEIDRLWRDYAEPPRVHVVEAR